MTRRLVLRAVVKALCLFFVFNVIYGLINPVQLGRLPSLYNVVFPGRVRFMKDYEFDAYRLVDDHVIAAARPETFNIVVLGSSEMWGTHSLPDLSVPAIMDRMGLVAADGRPVRVYNLGHPVPYGLKDLVLMEVILRREIPVDLVVLSTLDTTLSYYYPYQPVAQRNFALELDVIEHYSLTNAYQFLEGGFMGRSIPVFLQFWEDRRAVRVWLQMQMRGIEWTVSRLDFSNVSEDHLTSMYQLDEFYDTQTLDRLDPPPSTDFLHAFKQMSQEQDLPVILLASPVPYDESDFAPWLQAQAEMIGLPLIDCWDTFRDPTVFEDFYHIRREIHGPYAYRLITVLTDTRLASEGTGLPLHTASDFVLPPETCRLYPSTQVR